MVSGFSVVYTVNLVQRLQHKLLLQTLIMLQSSLHSWLAAGDG
jgi:hypothetical protein